jgi:hypothetical protein
LLIFALDNPRVGGSGKPPAGLDFLLGQLPGFLRCKSRVAVSHAPRDNAGSKRNST